MKGLWSLLIFGLVFFNTDNTFARGSSSSISRSSSFSSRSSSIKSTPTTSLSSSRSSSSSITASTSTKAAAVAPSALSQSIQKQSAMGTTAYSSQAQAQTSITAKTQTTTRYNSEPSTRPRDIPNDVNRGGVTYHVVYHDHGYGYYDNTGFWVAVAMANAQQQNVNYVQQQPDVVVGHNGHGFAIFIVVLLVLGGVITIAYFLLRN